jgi:butyryl-CoA dehydrogenase
VLSSELQFQLFEVHGADAVLGTAAFGHLDRDTLLAVLASAEEMAARRFAPIAAELDANEPRMVDGRAVTHPLLNEALRDYAEAGFIAAPFPRHLGGLGLPAAIGSAVTALFGAACTPAAGYVFLTGAAARVIAAFGDDRQRNLWLPPMLEGRWFGTMCLSEPHAGSSLLDVSTQAVAVGDGTYRIRGNKMWISGGDHDAAENIVHLVLARIVEDGHKADALSLFIVPRVRRDGTTNGIELLGLNKKLGHRGTTNCALAFGGAGESLGELLGPAHRGLQCMFHMMNEARIGVGTTAAVTAWAAYRYAAEYAFERRQGRRADTGGEARLIDHPDVRRMLLAQQTIAEGGLSLALFGACLVDRIQAETDGIARRQAEQLLDLLTPIIKSWCAERGVEANSLAIQTLGGAGYVRDHPVERLFRDQRLNPIHEGTNGILAIDLIVRKARRDQGLEPLLAPIEADARAALSEPLLAPIAQPLLASLATVRQTLGCVIDVQRDGNAALAFATPLALMVGDLAVAWMWLKQSAATHRRDDERSRGKRAAARYMVTAVLPQSLALAAAVTEGAAPWADLAPEAFLAR